MAGLFMCTMPCHFIGRFIFVMTNVHNLASYLVVFSFPRGLALLTENNQVTGVFDKAIFARWVCLTLCWLYYFPKVSTVKSRLRLDDIPFLRREMACLFLNEGVESVFCPCAAIFLRQVSPSWEFGLQLELKCQKFRYQTRTKQCHPCVF